MKKYIILLLAIALLVACQQNENETAVITIEPTIAENDADETATTPTETAETTEPTVKSTEIPSTAVVEATPVPEPTPIPDPKHLNICIANEPADLYLYGDGGAGNIRAAFYEGLYSQNEYNYQALGLEKLPDLADGDAIIGEVRVDAGDKIIAANGNIITLGYGDQLFNSDGELVIFEGDPIPMSQMQVTFKLQPMVWSDGTPVTAEDSIFSFVIAADPDSNVEKERVDKTAVYTAIDDHTIQWTGLPGWIDPTYFLNVWQPLPAHQLDRYSAVELAQAVETTQTPLANGAFILEEWTAGEQLYFIKNPHYYRADEGLPRVDTVTFHITSTADDAIAALQTGACDIALNDNFSTGDLPAILDAASTGDVVPAIVDSLVFEQISLGVDSVSDYTALHPNWFAQPEARQAATLCLDREAMVDAVLFGQGAVMDSYVSVNYPALKELTSYPYDPAAANSLLDDLNYIDRDGDGIRESEDGDPFAISINAPAESESRMSLAGMFADNMATCGITVTVKALPAASFYTDGPEGPIFGRKFDAALFAWLLPTEPACHLYTSANVTGEFVAVNQQQTGGWDNVNVTGWGNDGFDVACENGRFSFTNSEPYNTAHQEALSIYADQLPSIPLFSRLRIAATSSQVQNFRLDTTQPTPLWNIAEIDLKE